MRTWWRLAAVLIAIVAWAFTSDAGYSAEPQTDPARHFELHIAPLLARHCVECHGPGKKKGRLDLSRREPALAGGKSGKAIVPGKSAESLLSKAVESDEMPKDAPPLSREQKDLLRQWIDAGAAWPDAAAAAGRDPAENWIRRLTVPEYVETVRSATGVDIGADASRLLPRDVRADGFSNTAYNLNVDLGHVEAYAKLAEMIAARMDVVKFAAEHSSSRELADANMRQVIAGMGRWLLRGPLEEQEIDAFLRVSNAVGAEGGDFPEAVRYVVEAMLQSPRFVYRIEAGPLDAHELASRLSYILWGGPPDKELMRAADAGEFADRGRVEVQVRRMLQDPRAVERSARFIGEWLDLDRMATLRPTRERFPGWNERLAADMRDETLAFFKHVAWEQNRPLSELFNARVTFATPRLADHYGFGQTPSVVAAADAPSTERVTGGLRALYTFDEGGGDAVRDVSGAGDAAHLRIADPSAVRWADGGLTVHSSTLIAAAQPPAGLIDAVRSSGAITLEAWVTPANASQAGPARIVTLSDGVLTRNFTLGQDGDKFDVRFRTTTTNPSGQPSLPGPAGSAQPRRTHVVYTRDAAGRAALYIDGEEKAAGDVPGDLSNWDRGFTFALANETSRDRTWLGTYHLVAVYDRALTAEEVRQNRDAGARGNRPPAESAERRRDGLEALYTFDERGGDTVRDTSGAGERLDLKVENLSAVGWDDGGLTVNDPTLIASAAPPKRLIDAVKRSKAITIEAWVAPADAGQAGPARVVTLSSGTGQRNFTFGQDGDKFDVRFRTTATDGNGIPSLPAPAGTAAASALAHVVYTRDPGGKARLYVNGEEKASRDVGGDPSNWGDNFRLALANETTNDRPWRGTYRYVAIYSRALTADEIRSTGGAPPRARTAQVIARYDLSSAPGGRGGLLTQGSVLTVGGDDASMVTRGLFVLRDVLHGKVDDPPPCVDTTPVPAKPGLSQRGIAMQRLANSSCTGCHSKFEPLAFGLEKFDGVGAYHERDEHGNELRDDGEILFPGGGEPVKYQSSAQLMDLLAGSDRVRKVITRKVTQFAIGRPLVEADEPALDQIHESAQAGGGTYAGVITAVVMSDLVQKTGTETSP